MPKEYTASGIQMLENPRFTAENTPEFLSEQATEPVRRWQASAPGYAPTPLVGLSGLAQTLGVRAVLACSCGKALPCVSIVEPCEVACIYASAQKADGAPHAACGSGETMMAGLNCAEPCGITWPILRDLARFYFACPDSVSAHGMRVLAAPAPGDAPVISGESGAVGAGLLSLLCTNAEL